MPLLDELSLASFFLGFENKKHPLESSRGCVCSKVATTEPGLLTQSQEPHQRERVGMALGLRQPVI